MYKRLAERAATYEGYLGIEPARNRDGSGLAAVYFKDLDSIFAASSGTRTTTSASARWSASTAGLTDPG